MKEFGFSNTSKAYTVYNKTTLLVEESTNVIFYESNILFENSKDLVDDHIGENPLKENQYLTPNSKRRIQVTRKK